MKRKVEAWNVATRFLIMKNEIIISVYYEEKKMQMIEKRINFDEKSKKYTFTTQELTNIIAASVEFGAEIVGNPEDGLMVG